MPDLTVDFDFPAALGLQHLAPGTVALRFAAALLCAGLVGAEREYSDKPLGLRAFLLVALGAALVAILVEEMAGQGVAIDYGRAMQGVVGGLGFLGAGALIQRGSGLTGDSTAAGIWVAGGIGLACGFGALAIAAIATALVLFVTFALSPLSHRLRPRKTDKR